MDKSRVVYMGWERSGDGNKYRTWAVKTYHDGTGIVWDRQYWPRYFSRAEAEAKLFELEFEGC